MFKLTNTLSWIFIVLTHYSRPTRTHYSILVPSQTVFICSP